MPPALAVAPTPYHLGFVLGPRINAGGRIGDAALGAGFWPSMTRRKLPASPSCWTSSIASAKPSKSRCWTRPWRMPNADRERSRRAAADGGLRWVSQGGRGTGRQPADGAIPAALMCDRVGRKRSEGTGRCARLTASISARPCGLQWSRASQERWRPRHGCRPDGCARSPRDR